MLHSLPSGSAPRAPKPRARFGPILWLAALVIMLGAATWQRLTGPTYPKRGAAVIAGQEFRYRLPRSGISGQDLRVALAPPAGVTGTIYCRRFPTGEPFQPLEMVWQDGELAGQLPTQPRAGKLEYYVTLATPAGTVQVPPGEPLLMRFKGHVPLGILLPHVLMMFFSMLIGVWAALAAIAARRTARVGAWVALLGITVGGMILGPIVQKHAFAAYWTGWPLGSDLTDNKTAAMWLAWIVAVVVLQRRRDCTDRLARASVVLAALVMLAAYVVPHSLRGSQHDYGAAAPATAGRKSTAAGR